MANPDAILRINLGGHAKYREDSKDSVIRRDLSVKKKPHPFARGGQ